MKRRIEGRVENGLYVVRAPDGSVIYDAMLAVARTDAKLAAAIKRNVWQEIPEE